MKHSLINNFIFSIKQICKIDKSYIILKLFNILISSVDILAYAYLLKEVIRMLEDDVSLKKMIINIIIISLLTFVLFVSSRIISNFVGYGYRKIIFKLKNNFAVKVLDIDYQILERPETQDMSQRVKEGLSGGSIIGMVNSSCQSLTYLITVLLTIGIVLYIKWWLIIFIGFLFIFKILIENKNQKRHKKEYNDLISPIDRKVNYTNNISQKTDIGKDIRIFGLDKFINQERTLAVKDSLSLYDKDQKKNLFFDILLDILSFIDNLVLYTSIGYYVAFKGMLISTFSFLTASIIKLTDSLYQLISNNAELIRISLEVDDYREFLKSNPIKKDYQNISAMENVEIEFKSVYYSYYRQEGYALENVSFKINKGEKMAIVGYNGGGKTTLVKLLCGLYHPTKGEILINGHNIEDISREDLANLISPVFQETYTFGLSALENIGMDISEKVNVEKAKNIINTIDLKKKVDSLPNGLDTLLSREFDENGIELSGGEIQKLALARAMYKKSPIYILDEPTSALDAINEYNMYQNFNTIVDGKTTIYISHRLSSTRFCDRILFLEKGRVIEIGTHDELMQKETKYKCLFDMQAQYYKDGNKDEKH